MIEENELVSIGVPLRNGGALIAGALDQLVQQTYKNIEIIVSDNNSDDESANVCANYMQRDPRIKYYRQDKTISAIENFRFVQEKASGKYFMWAAHDDRRDLNFVEALVKSLQSDPHAVLAFSSAYDFENPDFSDARKHDYIFTKDGSAPFRETMRRLLYRTTHAYGLYRNDAFNGWYWKNIDFGWDQVFLAFIGTKGNFVKSDATDFYCFYPMDRSGKSLEERALIVTYKKLKPWPYFRRAWAIASAAKYGEALQGRHRSKVLIFLALYLPHEVWPRVKNFIRAFLPSQAVDWYRARKNNKKTGSA